MPFIQNLAYEASAGSGKTFMLVVRYLSLLFQGAEPSRILALTFTNKAASEMQERIVETLEDLHNRGELEEIVKVTEFSKESILSQRKEVLESFLNASTKIMTIDSFFTQILRKFSLYASLMPDFTTFAAQHEIKLMSRFLLTTRLKNKRDTLINLSLESNKRVSDIFTLLDQFHAKKEEFTGISFSRCDTKVYEEEALEAVSTLSKILNNSKDASKTAKSSFDLKSIEELLNKAWITRETLNYRTFSKCFTPEMDTHLHSVQNALKNYMRAKEQNFFYALSELTDLYKEAKKSLYIQESELSFSDVTSLVYEILNRLDESEFLYFRLDATLEHILLDEFQDTSILQYKILNPLIKEITSGHGVCEHGSFFFVGDVKQSIYRFRGGVSSLFGEVAKEHHTHIEKLRINYRSQKEIVSFVNETFIDKIKDYTPQQVRDDACGGFVSVMEKESLLEETLAQVKLLVDMGADLNNIAILCATNSDGEAMKNMLVQAKIEVITETTSKLITQQSVKALLEYLKYLYFKEDIYRHNFFALINRDVESLEFVDLNTTPLLNVIKQVIEQYKLFAEDFHLVRFLNAVANYQDIEALLFEYERMDIEAAASDINGVRVLTVHKSKGLEYDHVIVMDRLKKAPSARDSIIYEYDGIQLQNIFLRTKNRAPLDVEYDRALEKEKALVRQDTLNALYVAFTRAKENLFVIKKPKDSMFDLLGLEVCSRGSLACTKKDTTQNKERIPLKYKSLYYGTQSDILNLQQSDEEDLRAINFGLAMHYMLEMLGGFKYKYIEAAKNMMLNKFGHSLEAWEIDAIVQRVESLLESQEFLQLAEGKCYREKAIKYKNNLRYIDLLVKVDNGWRVIDYKSAFSFKEDHLNQVRSYVKAIKAITSQEVEGYICYLLDDGIKIIKT